MAALPDGFARQAVFVFGFGRGTLVKLAFFAQPALAANFPAGQTLRSAPLKNSPPPCLHKKFYLFTNAPPKHSPPLAPGCTYGASTPSQELGRSLSSSFANTALRQSLP